MNFIQNSPNKFKPRTSFDLWFKFYLEFGHAIWSKVVEYFVGNISSFYPTSWKTLQKLQNLHLNSFGKKKFKKRERGHALLGRPASLSARSHARPTVSPPPRVRARPALLDPTLATWRPYVGDVATTARLRLAWPGRDATPLPQAPPFSLSPPPSPAATPTPSSAVATLLAELRRSPPAVSTGHLACQAHRCVRHRRGKPLRTLNRGGKPPCDRNGLPEFIRSRRSDPPHWNPPFSAPFRLFLCMLCSGWPERAPTVLHECSTLTEWPVHGEQRRRAAIHASKGALAIPRPSQGHHRLRLAAGNTLVLTPWPEASPPVRSARRRCPVFCVMLTSGVGGPLSAARRPGWVEIWVSLAFSSANLKKRVRKWFFRNVLISI